jgi:sulfate adenylyltransferase subunit 1
MGETPLFTHKEYLFKFATKSCNGKVPGIKHKVDVNTLEKHAENAESLELNEIALADIKLTDKVAMDEYNKLPQTGAFIVIDRHTNVTVGAGMVSKIGLSEKMGIMGREYTQAEKELNMYICKNYPEWNCLDIS